MKQAAQRRTFLTYSVIGVCGIVIDLLLFVLLVAVFDVHAVLATIISTSAGITNNFILNAFFNFRKRDHLVWRFVSFYGVGATGILASGLILLVFSDLFALDATMVKIISVPPIVLAQYFLNKHVSFGGTMPSWRGIRAWLATNKFLVAANLLFLALSLSLVAAVPFIPNTVGAPDELQHYNKNVQFIMENHRLPVSGKDDIESLSTCRDNEYGQVPCLYSYQFHPAFNYIVSAVASKVGGFVGVGGITGARLASVAWGLLFINMTYLLGRFFLSRKQSVLLMAMIAFIPQVLFVASYVNQDIHSMAIAATVVYASVGYLLLGRKRLRWLLYLSFALLFVAKYNYFVVALVPAALLVRAFWLNRNLRTVAKEAGLLALFAVLLSGFWYVRNYLLYHDPLGQSFVLEEMSKYHELGQAWPLWDAQSYVQLLHFDFFNALFRSFFANLGYLYVRLDESYYTLVKLALLAGVTLMAIHASRKARWLLAAAGFAVAVAVFQVIVNSFTYDFQAQGRYLFLVLPVIAVIFAYVLADIRSRNPRLVRGLLIGGVVVIALLDWQAFFALGTALATHN
jgi:putative flippase GtrA